MKTIKAIKNQFKRAFTIVELVIVIAVIAILAAVLIPTFANLINNAEESNDMVTVSNLNKIVAAYDTVGDIDTVNDALDGVLENGYSVSALTPTSDGNVIVYDSNSNRFALITENALKTSTPEEDDIIYTDSTTTKTDWTTSTTWVFVKLSDVTATSNVYDLRSQSSNSAITGYNSYILTGSDDWDSKNVIAAYGVSLYDYTNTVTLGSVEIVNSDLNAQTASATNSSAKTAVAKTATATDTTVTAITVNVKAAYLSCTSSLYTISNYSTTTITAVKGCTLNEYGTTSIYDATEINGGKIINCNSSISKDIVIHVAEDTDVTTVLSDTTNTITVSTVTTTTETITVDTTSSTTVTIKVGSVTIISAESTTVDLSGTIASPYEIDSVDDLTKMQSTSGYYKLTNNVTLSSTPTIAEKVSVVLDLCGYTITSSTRIIVEGSLTVNDSSSKESGALVYTDTYAIEVSGTFTLNAGTITASKNYGIYCLYGGTAIVNGGTISSLYAPLSGNNTTGDMNFTVNGGVLTATQGPAIYMSGQVYLTITGGTINGGISLRMGQVTISGGTINAITKDEDIDTPTSYYNYSGNAWLPDALYVFGGTYTSKNETYGNSLNLTITGGTFNCENSQGSAVAIYDLGNVEQEMNIKISGGEFNTKSTSRSAYQVLSLSDIGVTEPKTGYGTYSGKVSTTITGGTFSSTISEDYIATGYAAVLSDGKYKVSAK